MSTGNYAFGDEMRRAIEDNLGRFERQEIVDDTLRRAAVAIVIVKNLDDDDAGILLTFRPSGMRRHARQFALPGGRMDEGETLVETALRELSEELRINLASGDVMGLLDDYPTRSGFAITPVVAWGGPAPEIDPDPEEVDKVFRIPFHELDSDAIPHFHVERDDEPPVMSSKFPSLGHRMFAPTAALIYQFREVGIRGLATRVADYGQPEFAWK
jgi:8-oxo-dGTP pyrophosphatase MutT (NUDIX family)